MPYVAKNELVNVEASSLLLRAYGPTDVADLLAAFADADISRWNPGPTSSDAVDAWAADRNDWTGNHASWAIADTSDRLIGSVSLYKIDPDQADAEIGYWIAPWARGRGKATGAVQAAVGFGFEHIGLHRVHLYHAVENLGSCAVARAAGFVHEGTLRQSYRYADGQYHDEHLHALLSSDVNN